MFTIVENKKNGFCKAYRCKCPRPAKDTLCRKHRHRYNKEANPLAYVYGILKSNARRRGKPFTITVEDFREFCEETNYLERRGKSGKDMSIDCKIQSLGYVKGNIRAISLSENSRKGSADFIGDDVPF